MTEQAEWRHGDVVVTEAPCNLWRIKAAFGVGSIRVRHVERDLFPDAVALAEFVDSQRPKPRYEARDTSVDTVTYITDRDVKKTVVRVETYDDEFSAMSIAEHLADWLNEQDDQ